MKTHIFSSAVASLLLLATFALTGCGTYRVVRKTANGGEIALQGLPDKAREEAHEYMASHCGGAFDIIEEGEAVVGTETSAQTERTRSVFGTPTQRTTASTVDKREWRIVYRCKNGEASKSPTTRGQPSTFGADHAGIHELSVRF